MVGFDAITGGIDVGVGGIHPAVHFDSALLAESQPGLLGEGSVGLNTDGDQHQMGAGGKMGRAANP